MIKNFFIIFLVFTANIYAQLNVQLGSLNNSTQPFFEVVIRTTYNSNNIPLSIDDILIKENNRTVKAISITDPNVQGFQTLRWIPYYDNIQGNLYNGEILVFKDGLIGSALVSDDRTVTPLIAVIGEDDIQIRNIVFGFDRIKQLELVQLRGKQGNNGFEPLSIDSITTRTDKFAVGFNDLVIAGNAQKEDPPFDMPFGATYNISVFYIASDFEPNSDVLTIYYNNGAVKEINLFGSPLVVEPDPVLELIKPVGPQTYSPCEDIELQWVGTTENIRTYVDVSFNGGVNWNQVANVLGNSYTYTLPDIITDDFKFRIRQDFNRTNTRSLPVDQNIQKIVYSPNGIFLASVTELGQIQIWDLPNRLLVKEFSALGFNASLESTGLYYLSDSLLAYTYYRYDADGNRTGVDTYKVFDISKDPVEEITSVDFIDYPVSESVFDASSNSVFMMGDKQVRLAYLNAITGQRIGNVSFNNPLSSITVNSNVERLVTASYGGEINIVNTQDMNIEKSINFDMIPNVIEMSLADNGEFLTLGSKKFVGDGSSSQVFILSLSTEQVFQFIEAAASDPKGISFSPKSTMMVIGSEFNPRIYIWDLVTRSQAAGFGNVIGPISDVSFSPVEQALAFSTREPAEIVYTRFTYPETDQTDSLIRIVEPILQSNDFIFDSTLIFSNHTQTFTAELCNVGESNYIFDNAWWNGQEHFDFDFEQIPDTIAPGECLELLFEFNPQDTGRVIDTLIFSNSCDQYALLELIGYGLPRNLSFFEDPIQFGEICVGDTIVKDTLIFINSDTIPILINEIRPALGSEDKFQVIDFARDTLIPPSGTFSAIISAVPDTLGIRTGVYEVIYFYQNKYRTSVNAEVKGIGTQIESSHLALPFIVEEPVRSIEIFNPSNTDVVINDLVVQPPGSYEVLTSLPITIAEGESTEIFISWDSTDTEANLVFEADPCPTIKFIPLAMYKGTSYLEIPDVIADNPYSNVEIPLIISNSSNYPYNGDRNFETEILLDDRIFFPLEINSNYDAIFINNGFIQDRRSITINTTGNYFDRDTLFVLSGVTGLTDKDTSNIEINPDSYLWGETVINTINNGLLIINGICRDRLILEDGSNIQINNIYPNPSNQIVNIELTSSSSIRSKIRLIDKEGKIVIEHPEVLIIGENTVQITLEDLNNGEYYIQFEHNNVIEDTGSVVKIK